MNNRLCEKTKKLAVTGKCTFLTRCEDKLAYKPECNGERQRTRSDQRRAVEVCNALKPFPLQGLQELAFSIILLGKLYRLSSGSYRN